MMGRVSSQEHAHSLPSFVGDGPAQAEFDVAQDNLSVEVLRIFIILHTQMSLNQDISLCQWQENQMKIRMLPMMTTIFTVESLGALAAELTSLSPGMNEIQVKHDGRSRRLIITTPKTFDRQGPYPILFCFHGAGGKAEGPSKRFSPHADKHGLIVISAEAVQPLAKANRYLANV